MKVGVKIMPKKEVLDSQGRAVERTLRHHSQDSNGSLALSIRDCRVGKYVVLDVNETDRSKAISRATEICEFVLYNPLTETYEIEVLN